MRNFMLTTSFFVLLGFFGILPAANIFAQPNKQPTLAISFDGKGTAMAWDVGVVSALFSHVPARNYDHILPVGSSSGSILAAYFACHGFSPTSIAKIDEAANVFPKDVLDEGTDLRGMLLAIGLNAETSLDVLEPIISLVTENGSCLPKGPLAIVAANLDVTDGRTSVPFAGRPNRDFNQGTYILSENGEVKGKVCTYFVTPAMEQLFADLKPEERLCDLRPILTSADLRLAILASVSEPTYFPAVPENRPDLIKSIFELPKSRNYGGGFVMNSVIQDLKRARPEFLTLGTGRAVYTRIQNRIIKNWFAFPMNEALLDQRWWFDAQIPMSLATWDRLYKPGVSASDHRQWGIDAMNACIASLDCRPTVLTTPYFRFDAHGRPMDDRRGQGLGSIVNVQVRHRSL